MGYTHYWRGAESKIENDDAWRAAVADCDKIIAAYGSPLDVRSTERSIEINGVEGEDCEDFSMPRNAAEIPGFDFCKTRGLPYDDVVTACLARLAEAGLYVSSDGEAHEWARGLDLAEKATGRRPAFPAARGD